MATMKLNDQAFKHAKSLIKSDDVARDTDWSEAQPSTDEENKFLEDEGRSEYAKWYLGYDPEEDKDNKSYYGFPYGDFERVHRDGLIAAKQRAAQNDYSDIEDAADELLQMIERE